MKFEKIKMYSFYIKNREKASFLVFFNSTIKTIGSS